jgi:hypothetical protein
MLVLGPDLKTGIILAIFICDGTTPWDRDKLKMCCRGSVNCWQKFFRNNIEKPLKSSDFLDSHSLNASEISEIVTGL